MEKGIYRHYKGDEYIVVGEALHTETGENLILYMPCYEPFQVFARPEKMFSEVVRTEEGNAVFRFAKIDKSSKQKL